MSSMKASGPQTKYSVLLLPRCSRSSSSMLLVGVGGVSVPSEEDESG